MTKDFDLVPKIVVALLAIGGCSGEGANSSGSGGIVGLGGSSGSGGRGSGGLSGSAGSTDGAGRDGAAGGAAGSKGPGGAPGGGASGGSAGSAGILGLGGAAGNSSDGAAGHGGAGAAGIGGSAGSAGSLGTAGASSTCGSSGGASGGATAGSGHVANCLDILNAGKSTGSGTYWVSPRNGAFQVYCDMTTDGGGWTRVVGINATDHNHVTSAAVNPCGMTTATALGKFSDEMINVLKSGSEPGFRLKCQNSTTPVTGYFSTTCAFSASATPNATGTCTAASYVYQQPEVYGGQYTQSCVVGVADGAHGAAERLIYGANANLCDNATTGCDTQNAHWSGNGSLWVR